VPITEWSLGSDTSLDVLVQACDMIKQSASASRNRVFVIETQGGSCGYLAVVGGVAAGAAVVYTPEEGIRLGQLARDVDFLRKRYMANKKGRSEGRIIIR
jgi:6-phosphofructokinase 1